MTLVRKKFERCYYLSHLNFISNNSLKYSYFLNMVMCAVDNCENNNNKKGKVSQIKCRYFSFPRNEQICDLWVQRCSRSQKFNTATARICSMHFTENDYCLQHRLLNYLPSKMKLKSDAVPSINLINLPQRRNLNSER